MSYVNWVKGLPRVVQIIFAIIPPLHLFFLAAAIVEDVLAKKWLVMVLDIIFGGPLGIVYWILNIIWVIGKKEIFTFGVWVKDEEKKEAVEVKVEEKEEPKAE